jgi:hypothetical protein
MLKDILEKLTVGETVKVVHKLNGRRETIVCGRATSAYPCQYRVGFMGRFWGAPFVLRHYDLALNA